VSPRLSSSGTTGGKNNVLQILGWPVQTIEISLEDEHIDWIEQKLEEGDYGSESEVLREAIQDTRNLAARIDELEEELEEQKHKQRVNETCYIR
jgi:putative addiction module CopG family antidote